MKFDWRLTVPTAKSLDRPAQRPATHYATLATLTGLAEPGALSGDFRIPDRDRDPLKSLKLLNSETIRQWRQRAKRPFHGEAGESDEIEPANIVGKRPKPAARGRGRPVWVNSCFLCCSEILRLFRRWIIRTVGLVRTGRARPRHPGVPKKKAPEFDPELGRLSQR